MAQSDGLKQWVCPETSRTLTKLGFESAGSGDKLFEPNTLGISKLEPLAEPEFQGLTCVDCAVINIMMPVLKNLTRDSFSKYSFITTQSYKSSQSEAFNLI